MGRGAADGAAIARLRVTDPGQRGGEQRLPILESGPRQQFSLAHGSADANGVAFFFDTAERFDPHDVDHARRARKAHREHRHQGLAARQHARVFHFRKGAVHVADAFGAQIIELCRLHGRLRNSRVNQLPARGPPARRARASKNCRITTRAAASSKRPPIEATLPPISAP